MQDGIDESIAIFCQFLADGNLKKLSECFAPNAVLKFPGTASGSEFYLGRDKIMRIFKKLFYFIPDLHFEIVRYLCKENEICVEWSFSGNTRKGRLILRNGVSIVDLKDEHIAVMTNYIASGLFV